MKPDVIEPAEDVDQEQKASDRNDQRLSYEAGSGTRTKRGRESSDRCPRSWHVRRAASADRPLHGLALNDTIAHDWVGDVLHMLLAETIEPDGKLIVHLIVDRAGDQDSAGLR